jgi:hypothetical protein
VRVDEAAIRLHEEEPRVPRLARDLVDVAAQDRREIGVDHGRVAAPDHLHERAHLVANRDLGEADLARERGDLTLVLGPAIAVQEDDRGRAYAGGEGRFHVAPRRLEVWRAQHLALCGDTLVDLDDALVEKLGQDDVAREELRPVLVGNAELVGEAFRDDEERALTLALEERIGGNRRPHLDRLDSVGRKKLGGR